MAYLVGISGGSASGKTTFINNLKSAFDQKHLAVLSMDDYYKPLQYQQRDEAGAHNFDMPESIDLPRFLEDLDTLQRGEQVLKRAYTFNNPAKSPEMMVIEPASVIVVEGLFVFEERQIAEQLDLKLFLDVEEEIRWQRRLDRDLKERGLNYDDIHYQWHNHVKPSFDKYLLPHKSMVDIIILNNQGFENGINMVINYLKTLIKEEQNNLLLK
jgi:uridine kinase